MQTGLKIAATMAAVMTLTSVSAQAKYLAHDKKIHSEALRRQSSTPSLPIWTFGSSYQGTDYTYKMVGTDPSLGSATTTVPTYIIPLIFTFPDGTVLDPTKNGQINTTLKPVNLTVASPVFQNAPFVNGKVNLGTTQYIDAFQRANFWKIVSSKSPNYHVLLGQPTILPAITIKVTDKRALQKQQVVVNGVKKTFNVAVVATHLADDAAIKFLNKAANGIKPNSFPIFLSYNVSFKDSSGGACGYHSNVGNQTYTVTMFDDNNVCGNVDGDVDTLTHEVAEWMDDPMGDNTTPDQSGILEVGDPASDFGFYVTLGNFKYTLQDLMFHDWFTCTKPSTSANKYYDYMHKFSVPDC